MSRTGGGLPEACFRRTLATVRHALLFPLLILAGCASSPPLVTSAGALPGPAYSVDGGGPAADELRRQLQGRGWLSAAPGAPLIRTAYAAAPRAVGICAQADPAAPAGCKAWLDPPQTGWTPFAPPLRYRLTLDLGGAVPARITVIQAGGKSRAPLPGMVSAALTKLGPG